jgi:osmotically-inducible protein OsmY
MRVNGGRRAVRMIGCAAVLGGIGAGLSGCIGMAIGGAATVGVAAQEERGVGGALTDTRIRTDINTKWMNSSMDMLQKLDLSVQEGRVLIAGTLPTPEMRVEAVKLVWQVEGVREVINQVKIGEDSSGGAYARDVWISTQLRSSLLFDRYIQSVNYSVDTVDGVVYLMGVAQSQNELDRATNYARNLRYVKRVVSYVRIKDQPAPAAGATATRPADAGPGAVAAPAATAGAPPDLQAAPTAGSPDRAPVEATPLAPPDKPS